MNRIFLLTGNTLKSLSLCTVLLTAQMNASAQCGFGAGLGCANTDYANFGYNSNNNAATIEYDNFISTFHSTIVRDSEGRLQIWGQSTGLSGSSLIHLTAKTEINSTNFPGLSGTPLKAAMGSNSISGNQVIILTTTGLHAWGNAGAVMDNSTILTNQSTVKKISSSSGNNINNYGLPGTVAPADVKMMFATHQTLAIVTCTGEAYVLSQNVNMRGAGSAATSETTWYQVKANGSGNPNLTGVVAVRGNATTLMALTNNNKIYTWGEQTLLGTENTSNTSARSYATEMALPETGNVKMIGATTRAAGSNATTYYVLFTNGHLWAMGNNQNRQLGDWGTTASPSSSGRRWVQPRYPQSGSNSNDVGGSAGSAMEDIVWISPSEHDRQNAVINVINRGGRLWNFGTNAGIMLGRTPSSTSYSSNINPLNPGQPFATAAPNVPTAHNNFDPLNSMVLAVETGGHTTMIATECEQNFGYVGHATNGSAGNSINTNYSSFSYATATVNICGAAGIPDVILSAETVFSGTGKICASQTVGLEGSPSGGTFSIVSGPGSLTGNMLSFTANTGTVTIGYTVNGTCGTTTVNKEVEIEACTIYKVRGSVWLDNNANAINNTGENGTNGATVNHDGLWANLVNNSGEVVVSVPVSADGTYELSTIANGNYSVQITNAQVAKGVSVPASAQELPEGWEYTGHNQNGTPCTVPGCATPGVISGIVVNSADVNGNSFGIKGMYTVSGNVYQDGNGLTGSTPVVNGTDIYGAVSDYETEGQPQLYISVIDVEGTVVHYVPVAGDGSYTIDIPLKEDAVLQLTTTVPVIGSATAAPSLSSGWVYAGEDFGADNGSGNGINDGSTSGTNAPATRYDGKIAISFPGSNTLVSGVDFGVQSLPVAEAKEYMVSNANFGIGSPGGAYPVVAGYKYIPMSSAALIEVNNSTNGSLSGKDKEDCATGNCNGNTGGVTSTFSIGTINSNTKLYYDFGPSNGGVLEVSANTVIADFDVSNMIIYGQTGQGTGGNELGFTYAITDRAGYSSSYVTYEIESIDALPIRLISFNAYRKDNTAELVWATATEQNSKSFEIQHSSDSKVWNTIGVVSSKAENGESHTRLDYDFIHSSPVNGNNLYRLKNIEFNGYYDYSPVRVLNFGLDYKGVRIHPNPADNVVRIEGLSGNSRIRIYDVIGRLVAEEKADESFKEILLNHWSKGVYHIHITESDGSTTTHKLIKE